MSHGLLKREEIIAALERLGQVADAEGQTFELVVLGGACMVLAYQARQSTRDVDVAILSPREAAVVRQAAKQVAAELGWPEDWLNDAAKGYLVGLSAGPVIHESRGIQVRQIAPEQLLAMKLSAWRDEVDIGDARRLLQELQPGSDRDAIWKRIEPYLVPGRELKAQYAFLDLWEALYGND